jgi:hypothetical protein
VQMEKICNPKNFNYFFWTPFGSRINKLAYRKKIFQWSAV